MKKGPNPGCICCLKLDTCMLCVDALNFIISFFYVTTNGIKCFILNLHFVTTFLKGKIKEPTPCIFTEFITNPLNGP